MERAERPELRHSPARNDSPTQKPRLGGGVLGRSPYCDMSLPVDSTSLSRYQQVRHHVCQGREY